MTADTDSIELKNSYDRDGFAVLHDVFSDAELEELRQIMQSLMARFDELQGPRARDVGAVGDVEPGSQQPEIDRSALFEPALLETAIYRKVNALAGEMLGRKTRYVFDHVICKMPHCDTPTHWHQDRGYMIPHVSLNTINFWIPLQDVDESNGAMRYIAGSHKEYQPHRREDDLHPHVLTTDAEEDKAIICKMKKGDVVMHHPLSLHGSGPNTTDKPRLAWSLHFGAYGRLEYLHPKNVLSLAQEALRRATA
jgi:ectoine hydroxylase-related dioxygenase (phytanoyl-CoA dioxygenase family)